MNVFSRSEWIWIKDNGADTYAEFLLEFEYKKNSSVKLRILYIKKFFGKITNSRGQRLCNL